MRYASTRQWERAEQHILRAIKKHPSYTDAYIAYTDWLLARHQYSAAAKVAGEGKSRCPDGSKIFQRPLAVSLVHIGEIDEALNYIPVAPKDSFWKALRRQAFFVKEAMLRRDTGLVTPVGQLWGINTKDPELFPSISADGKTFYFTRRMNGQDEDFFYAKPDTCGGWQSARNMGSPPNTLQQEGAQFISADGHYLFFMRCDNRSISGWDQGGCDLYMAYRADSIWSIPQSFGGTINTPGYEGMPCLSSDNRELYFVSNREGGYGGLDIWSSCFEHGLWQPPQNLGPAINTSGDETAPFVYADNATLFFASTGKEGAGGADLFYSKRVNDTSWSEAINMGMPVNSVFDETALSLNAAGDTAYFASDRDSAAGNFDLYQYPLRQAFKPYPVMYVKGWIYDSIGRGSLNYASIYISDVASGKDIYHVQSNRGDGSYMIALPIGGSYNFLTDRIGFQRIMDTMRVDDSMAGRTVVKNISLLPFDYQKPVMDTLVSTVFFVRNSVSITDADRMKIETDLAPWKGKSGITVLVNGYTDNTGTPMLNEQLSYTRARLIAEVIKAAGFPADVIQSQGWGEANPRAENDTDEHRDMNRRVEIIVRE